jgi:hypothetical protein
MRRLNIRMGHCSGTCLFGVESAKMLDLPGVFTACPWVVDGQRELAWHFNVDLKTDISIVAVTRVVSLMSVLTIIQSGG